MKQLNRKRVLFLSYNGLLEPLLYSQGVSYLKALTKELNIEIIILSFEKRGLLINQQDKEQIQSLEKELLKNNIRWHRAAYHKFPPVLSSVYDILVGVIKAGALAIKSKIAFIHARSYVPGIIALVLHKLLKIDYIFDMRGYMIDDYVALGVVKNGGAVFRIAKKLERLIGENAASLIVLTQKAYQALPDFTGIDIKKRADIEIIPCCVDIGRFQPQGKDPSLLNRLGLEGKFVLIYVGSLGKLYQPRQMLDFFKICRGLIPKSHFLMITPDIKELARQRSAYKDEELFKDITYLKAGPKEMPEYIALADAALAFYLPSPSRVANSPTKIGEYLACGIPLIVNRGVGDTEEWVSRYKIGIILEGFNDNAYKEAGIGMINLVKDGNSLKQRCRRAAEELLSLEIAKDKYFKIYSRLIA